MSKIRILVVDDSPFVRKALLRIFDTDPSIEVVGIARNGKEAIEKAEYLRPDAMTLDVMMPEMDGIETLKILMEEYPMPVLMLSQFTKEGAELTLKALELGAMDFVDKSSVNIMDFANLSSEITAKVRAIAGKKPFRILGQSTEVLEYKSKGLIDIVALGTSTGGPPALQLLLQKFPQDISFGIVIVQHMPPGFIGPLATRLNGLCKIKVKEAEDGEKIESGTAFIAPSGLHMTVSKSQVKLVKEPADTIHRPSVDVMFSSVAENFKRRVIGVIMTGMGSDGARGMEHIKQKGGITIAQSESTCTIFGMPRVAIERGVVDKVLPITDIADEIMKTV